MELNKVSKAASVLQCQAGLLLNDRDGTSEIVLPLPLM
jgi:hypothetical protein